MSNKFLGVDVSKDEIAVALLIDQRFLDKVFSNNKAGYLGLERWLSKEKANGCVICMEATGKYGDALAEAMHGKGYQVKVINPLKIKSFARTKLALHKTDKVDARLIAEYAAKFPEERLYQPLNSTQKQLKELSRARQVLTEYKTQYINQLEHSSKEAGKTWTKMLKTVEKELKSLDKKLEKIIKDDDNLAGDFKNLNSVKGIAKHTAIKILSEFNDINKFQSARQFAAYLGLTPVHTQSGTSVRKRGRISRMGNSYLRKALYFPAIVAKNHNEYFKKFADKLLKRGKKPLQIIAAIMRKLAHVIYGIIKHKEAFDASKLSPHNLEKSCA